MGKAPIISKRSGNPVDSHIGLRIRSRQLAWERVRNGSATSWGSHSNRSKNTRRAPTVSAVAAWFQSRMCCRLNPSFFFEGGPPNDTIGAPKSVERQTYIGGSA